MMGIPAKAKRKALLAMAILAGAAGLWSAEAHHARGIVIAVGKGQQALDVSCEAIPGFMDAMEMSFAVRDPKVLATVQPGMTVQFKMVEENHVLYADDIQASWAISLLPALPVVRGFLFPAEFPFR
jgi:Cu/Ag efflux protein CusF